MENSIDYKKLGLKIGLEIHQQLDTNKLFCNCPSILKDDKPDFVIERKLRAVAGETGEIDAAAAHAMAGDKKFFYEGYYDTTCLVEIDEEPITSMNKDALYVALQVSKVLNANVVDLIIPMRKTVIDGSNTSGFQRTAVVALNGHLDVSGKRITVPTVCIEEEASKIIEKKGESTTYRLDRLGIPLVEIGTGPDIDSPELCREAAEKLGMILRSTGKVKRGLGTIRQDVNVSIKGGARIEIKGAQDLKMMSKWIENEVLRQQSLLKLKEEIKGDYSDILLVDLTHIFKSTECKVIESQLKEKGVVLGIKLSNFRGRFAQELCPGKRIGTEFSDYAKSISLVGGLFHTDELPKYGVSEEEVKQINEVLGCKHEDGFIIVCHKKAECEKALHQIIKRVNMLQDGIPKEVRKANDDGTTTFQRPMPGSARMYPETDTLPIVPDMTNVKMPELISEKEERFSKLGLSNDLAEFASKSKLGSLFEELVEKNNNVPAEFIASVLFLYPKDIKSRLKLDSEKISEDNFKEVIGKLNTNELTKEAVFDILCEFSKGNKPDYSKYKSLDLIDVETEIKKIIEENKGKTSGAVMGIAMAKFRGKVEGKKIMELINKHLK